MITKIVLVRHGTTMTPDDEIDTLFRQNRKSNLNHLGLLQGEGVAKSVSVFGADILFSSQYTRAIETANIITQYHPNLFINTDSLLNELTRIVDGVDMYSELNRQYREWRGKMLKDARIHDKFHPTDQSLYEKLEEMLKFVGKVIKECAGQKVIVVGHSQGISLFLSYIDMINAKNESPESLVFYFNKRFMNNGGITTIEYDDRKDRWTIVRFNDTRHLP